jgi:hypothetical protein
MAKLSPFCTGKNSPKKRLFGQGGELIIACLPLQTRHFPGLLKIMCVDSLHEGTIC